MQFPPTSPDAASYQAAQDAEHLRWLSIGYYVWGGLIALLGCFGIFHILMGLALVNGQFPMTPTPGSTFPGAGPPFPPATAPNNNMPPGFGWIFVGMGSAWMLLSFLLGGLTAYAGRLLTLRKGKTFIQFVAALQCLHMPIGTLLGVFTFIVLGRPSVAALFSLLSTTPIPPIANDRF